MRPTSERARQAFFNIVAERITGARFLDLYAGSGAFAFEAVSRGATSAIAVDTSRHCITAITSLAAEWRTAVSAVQSDALTFLRGIPKFDLAYADPPYDFDRYPELLTALDRAATAESALVAIEHRRHSEPFAGIPLEHLRPLERREYGEIWIAFFESNHADR